MTGFWWIKPCGHTSHPGGDHFFHKRSNALRERESGSDLSRGRRGPDMVDRGRSVSTIKFTRLRNFFLLRKTLVCKYS